LLLRPDNYIAFIDSEASSNRLKSYFQEVIGIS
jgi:hypothetical protein